MGKGVPSLEEAVEFYLSIDPIDPIYIPAYRRSLLMIPESRWYLGIIMKRDIGYPNGPVAYYTRLRENHQRIMQSIIDEPLQPPEVGEIPLLRKVDVKTICDERLTRYFWRELDLVVRAFLSYCPVTPMADIVTARAPQ
jgi:hypothetical protein